MTTSYSERTLRTRMLVGDTGIEKLLKANVTVVGLGAVGSYVIEAVARAGVGNIRIVDFDIIKGSNFNRQILAVSSNLDKLKTEVAKNRILDINPDCNVEVFNRFIDLETINEIFSSPTDIVVDAIDAVNSKALLLSEMVKRNIPVVSSMGAAYRTDPTAIRVADLSETDVCQLAMRMRKKLRKLGVEKGITCIYSIELPQISLIEDLPEEPNFYPRGRTRRPLGSISYLTGMFGLMASREVLRFILGK